MIFRNRRLLKRISIVIVVVIVAALMLSTVATYL